MEEKYDIEKLADDINRNLDKYREDFPLLVKKLPKESAFGYMGYATDCTVSFLNEKSCEYDRLKLGTDNRILNRIEEVLKHWDNVHAMQKEKKKAKKKLSKVNIQ